MNQFRVSDEAREDLNQIWAYIAQDNADAADWFIQRIVSKFGVLASMPEIGRRRDELSSGLRGLPVNNHIIFYRSMDRGVEIVRVLHGARDFSPLFE